MADFGAPVADHIQPPNPNQGLTTLSDLLAIKSRQIGIAQQQVALQSQQQQLSSAQSAATQAAIHAQNLKGLQSVNWAQFNQPDGSYDIEAAQAKAAQVGGADAPEFSARLANMAHTGTAAKQSLFSLNQEQQAPIRAIYGTWAANAKLQVPDLLTELQTYQKTLPAAQQANVDQMISATTREFLGPDLYTGQPRTLAQQKQLALGFARAGLTPSEVGGAGGIATPGAGTVNTGTQVVPTTTNRETGVTQRAPGAAPLANLSDQISLPNGQVAILNRQTGQYEVAAAGGGARSGSQGTQGNITPAMTAQNDPARPSANAPAQLQAQWQKALGETNTLVHGVRQEDQSYGNNMAIAQDVRSLSRTSGGKDIGPGTPEWTRLIGSITSRFGGSQGITNIQTLESFLDRQAASMTSAMGLPATNLGNEQARTISGNIGMQVGALRAKNDYNEALAQGLHDFRSGLDHVAGFGGNASPTAVNRYRNQWAQVFNPMAIEYKLARSRDDKPLMTAIAKSVTGSQAKRMMIDLEAMDSLAKSGKLP